MRTTRPADRSAAGRAAGIALTAVVLAACASPGTGSAPGSGSALGAPVTVTSCSHTSTVTTPPTRVVLGFPGTISTLEALGVADSVYGYALGSYAPLPAGFPADAVEVSPDYAPSREAMIAADADFFLGNDEGQVTSENGVTYADLDSTGTATYILGSYCTGQPAPKDLKVVYDDVEELGTIFGVPDRADTLVQELQKRVATAAQRGKDSHLSVAYVQVYDGKIYALAGYPVANLLAALGLTNEFADLSGNFAEITKEEALTRTPDVVFVVAPRDQSDKAVAEASSYLAGTPAVQAKRVYATTDDDFQSGGVALIDHLDLVADTVFGPA